MDSFQIMFKFGNRVDSSDQDMKQDDALNSMTYDDFECLIDGLLTGIFQFVIESNVDNAHKLCKY